MKSAIKTLLVVIISSIGLLSCEDADFFPCVKPSGKAVEEFRFTKEFHNVHLTLHSNVHIRQGSEFNISIKAAQNILDLVDIHSNGTTLYIENSRCVRTRANDINIYITMPELEAVRLSGSGNIYVQTPFEGNNGHVEVSGSGNVYFPEAWYENFHVALSGSGNVNLAGACIRNTIQVTGSGKISAFGMVSREANVRISGSGNVNLHVTDYLEARISGSGNINYIGNPSVSVRITGSGKFNHVNDHQLF